MENSNGSTNGSDFLRVEGVVKNFGAVFVLKGVDLHVREGEVLGLIGDNGAGKSTLLKTITGFHRPDDGRILIEGEEVNLRSVSQARSLGIQTVYQDLALVNELSVFHNMFLNGEMTIGPFPEQPQDEREDVPVPPRHGCEHPVHRHRGGEALGRAAPGHSRRAGGLLGREDAAPR